METAPAVAFVVFGAAAAVLAMNILITAPPIALPTTTLPPPSPGISFGSTPSLLPFASVAAAGTPVPRASLSDHQPRFVHSVIKSSDPGGVWSVYLSYPAFILGETPWAQQIDSDIRADLTARAGQWSSGPAAFRWARGRVNTLTSTFTTELVTPEIASWTMTFVDDSSARGPISYVETFNYDLATGQRLTLDDVFIDDTSLVTVASEVAPGLLRSVLGTAYVASIVDEGTSPLLTNYDNWAVDRGGLRITFNQYQVANQGPILPSIVVPWSQLTSIMNDTGPVAELAGLS